MLSKFMGSKHTQKPNKIHSNMVSKQSTEANNAAKLYQINNQHKHKGMNNKRIKSAKTLTTMTRWSNGAKA